MPVNPQGVPLSASDGRITLDKEYTPDQLRNSPYVGMFDDVQLVTANPIGGTFQVTYRHGASDPIPYNAPCDRVAEGGRQAQDRDAIITEMHNENPADAAACRVCSPPRPSAPPARRLMVRLVDRALRVRRIARRVLWGVTR